MKALDEHNLPALKWLYAPGFYDDELLESAMEDYYHVDDGRYDVVKWLSEDNWVNDEQRVEVFEWLLNEAQERYYLDEVKWLLFTDVYHVSRMSVFLWYRREKIRAHLRREGNRSHKN